MMEQNQEKRPYRIIEHNEHEIGRFTVVYDKIDIEGKIYPYSYTKVDNCSIVIPIKGDEVILIEQYRHSLDDWFLEFPAGGLGTDGPETAATRELREETGYVAEKLLYLGEYPISEGTSTAQAHIFVAKCGERLEQKLEKTEYINVISTEISIFKEMIRTGRFKHSIGLLGWYLFLDLYEGKIDDGKRSFF